MRLVHPFLVLLTAVTAAAAPRVTTTKPVTPPANYSMPLLELPVTFERNAGQFPAETEFVSRTQGQTLSLNAAGATVVLGDRSGPKEEIRLRFEGARRDAAVSSGKVVSHANYIQGNDPSRWLTGVTAHESVRYDGVYEGIDVEYHARRGALEYDVIVSPGADWRTVSIAVDGAAPVLEANGDLLLCSAAGEIRHHAPYTYQNIEGRQVQVESRYDVRDGRIAFVVGEYDRSQPLIIDPVLDFARAIFPLYRLDPTDMVRDANGNIYVTGWIWAPTATSMGGNAPGLTSDDILVAKLSPDASLVLFTTYIGGTDREHFSLAALGSGDIFVTGATQSADFPTTAGVVQELVRAVGFAPRAYLVRLDGTTGAVEYSTYLSASNLTPRDIVVDGSGRAIVGGETSFSGGWVVKLAADGKSYVFFNGAQSDVDAVAVDPDGFVYLGGGSAPAGMTTTAGAYRSATEPGFSTFLSKLTPEGAVVFTTYAPGGTLADIAVDASRNIVAAVSAHPSAPYPVSANAYQKVFASPANGLGGGDMGIFKMSASGATLIASTLLGGEFGDTPKRVAIGPSDSIYVMGATFSNNFPVVQPVQGGRFGTDDTILAKFSGDLSSLLFSTYFGPSFAPAMAVAPGGDIYLLTVSGGRVETGPWLRGAQPPFAPYANSQIAHFVLAGSHGFSVDYIERRTALAGIPQDSKDHIRGTGFLPGVELFFGDNQASSGFVQVFAGGTAIRYRTPAGAEGTVDVKVQNPDTNSFTANGAFVYQPGRSIITQVDGTIDTHGNGVTTITGAFFPPAPTVRVTYTDGSSFIEQDVSREIVGTPSPTTITFKLPPMPFNARKGFFDVPHPRDVHANVITDLQATFVPVTQAPLPNVRELRSASAPTTGGGTVTILGSDFHQDARVIIGNVFSRNVTFVDPATLLAEIPPNVGGPADVAVLNPDNSRHTLSGAFVYRGVTSLSNITGRVAGGDSIQISGHGFVNPVSVTFGGIAATNVVRNNANQISVLTPAHAAGFVDVVVVSGPDTYTLQNAFRYLDPAPSISSMTPTIGPAAGGTAVQINGTGFLSGAKVFFDNIPATSVAVVSSTQITAVTPAGTAGQANVKVQNFDDQFQVRSNFFMYTGIGAIAPVQGPPGIEVEITGGGFANGSTVTVGGTPATGVIVDTATQIRFTVPAHAPGIVDIVVHSGTDTFTKTNGFRVLAPPPTITGFTPATGLPGSSVTITGTNFVDVLGVDFFDGAQASFTVDSPTQITAIVPNAGTPGVITVETESGIAVSADSYNVENAAAEINSFTPTAGSPGTTVTITGVKMGGATSVRFNGTNAASFSVISASEIQAVVPEGGSTGPICIITAGPFTGCSSMSFTYPPQVTGFSPSSGLPGDPVTINGVDFLDVISVAFNNTNAASFTVNPARTSITTTVPAGATTGLITVTTAAGAGSSNAAFGVRPVISSFTPARSGIGTTVTITGLRFSGATGVTIGGASATFTVISETQIQAKVPANAVDGPITVVTPGGSATSSTSFIVALTPFPSSFSPTKGTPGTSVSIIGKNFSTATAVRFNGTNATFTIESNTLITAIVPAAATNGPISVVNEEGEGATSASFYLPPVLSNFAPNAGAIGSNVIINGNNFNGTLSVVFSSGATATFTVNAQDKITAVVPANAVNGPITVTTPYGPVTSTFAFTVTSASTPTVTATAISASQIQVTWTGDATHTYQVRRIERSTDRFTDNPIANVTGNTFTDTGRVAGKTYLYNIMDTATGLIGNADSATTIMFTDDPLNVGMTIKLAHLTQLRSAVNAMRVAGALPTRTWTDANPLFLRTVHINELRSALAEAYLQLNRHVTFSDQPLPPAMVIRAAHFTELRGAVK